MQIDPVIRFPRRDTARFMTITLALVMVGGCALQQPQIRPHHPQTPWPRDIPIRTAPEGFDELFVLTLGEVQTPLADGTFNPVHDRVSLDDGTTIDKYYRETLRIPHYAPIDKSVFRVPPTGWCSWYYYYEDIPAEEVLRNARWVAANLQEYGMRYVQIDDGWQVNRDWTTFTETYRELGMDGLAAEIHNLGLEAGVWVVPHGQSNEKVARDSHAFLWKLDGESAYRSWLGGFVVDPSVPQVHAYLRDLFTTLRQWGFSYFKIDGQPMVPGYFRDKAELMAGEKYAQLPLDERVTRLYRDTIRTIRDTIGPESYLLGCWGTPLDGMGMMNGARTAHDVHQGWGGFVLAVDALQRWNFLHNIAWYCDPDVLLVRPPLTDGTARAWATLLGLTGQALLTSDRLPDLPPARVELLRRVCPAVDIRPLDLFRPDNTRKPLWDLKIAHDLATPRSYDVVAVCNFREDRPHNVHLSWQKLGLDPQQAYHVYDFWRGIYLGAWKQGMFVEIPPADVRVITLVPATDRPVLVSTNRHITQGWVDVLALEDGGSPEAPILRGRSRVIGGDPYRLTIGLPPGAHSYRLVDASVQGTRPRAIQVRHTSHLGYATVTIDSRESQEVEWELRFEATTPFARPVNKPRDVAVSQGTMLGSALVTWNDTFRTRCGYRVLVDGQPIGVSMEPRALVPDLQPGKTYKIGVETVWWDGSSSDAVEVEHTVVAPDVQHMADLEPLSIKQNWKMLQRNRSVNGNPLSVAGVRAEKGLGTHAESRLVYRICRSYDRFEARVGIDDETSTPEKLPEATFEVWGDGRRLWHSEPVHAGQPAAPVSVDVSGVEVLELRVGRGSDGPDNDHADWLEPRVVRDAGDDHQP